MSVDLRPKISMPGGKAAVGLIAGLGLAVAVALSGCTGTEEEQHPMAGGKTGGAAGAQVPLTCEQSQQQALANCQQVYGGATGNLDDLELCQAQAAQNLEACRGN